MLLGMATASGTLLAQKTPIGIGFLGASYSHFKGKFQVIRESADWRLVGIAESDAAIRDNLQKQGVTLLSRDELLRHADIRVIVVESDVPEHAADGLAVLQAGKHLHLEKAPAANFQAFSEIVKLAQQKNLVLQIGYMWRYHPAISKALEAARSGWLGQVNFVKATIATQIVGDRRAELARFPGGIMFELGGHVVDPMVRLMGEPRKVTPFLRTDGPYHDNLRDNTLAVLEWDKAIGIVQTSTLEPDASRSRSFELHGSNGRVVVNPIEPPAMYFDLAKPAGPYQSGMQKIQLGDYRRFVDDFAELAAVLRGESHLRVTPDEDLKVERALLACGGMA